MISNLQNFAYAGGLTEMSCMPAPASKHLRSLSGERKRPDLRLPHGGSGYKRFASKQRNEIGLKPLI
jgi:hypothetical protein